jgi:hypothetical protein
MTARIKKLVPLYCGCSCRGRASLTRYSDDIMTYECAVCGKVFEFHSKACVIVEKAGDTERVIKVPFP